MRGEGIRSPRIAEAATRRSFDRLGAQMAARDLAGDFADRPETAPYGATYKSRDTLEVFWYGGKDIGWLQLHGEIPGGGFTWEAPVAGAVIYSDADKHLWASEDLTWDATLKRLGIGTNAPLYPLDVVGQARVSSLTAGSVLFAGAAGLLSQDNANLFWDATNKRLGIGTAAPAYRFHSYLPKASATYALHVGEGTYGVSLGGATGVANRLSPMLLMYACDVNDGGAQNMLIGAVDAASDVGTNPVFRFDGRRAAAAVVTRPVFGFYSYTTHLADLMPNGQVCGVVGSAGAPTYAFFTYPTMGFWASAANRVNLEVGGLQVSTGTISTQGVAGVPSGTGPGAELRYTGGRVSLLGYNRGTPAYVPVELVGSALYFNLSGTDKASITAGPIFYLVPHSPSLTVEGEEAMDSTHNTLRWYLGGMQQLGASLLDTALVADVTVTSVGGDLAETEITSKSVQSAFSVIGNSVKCYVTGSAILYPRGSAGNSTMHIYFRIEGTNVLDLVYSAVYGEGPTWINFEFEFVATVRSSTEWMIGNVKGRGFGSSEALDPRPNATTSWSDNRYRMTAPFTVSGNVATSVRCSIANATGGESTCTVHQHQFGLEQT